MRNATTMIRDLPRVEHAPIRWSVPAAVTDGTSTLKKEGRVAIPGDLNDDLPPRDVEPHPQLKQAGLKKRGSR